MAAIILTSTNVIGQNDTLRKESLPSFMNQGKQEDYWARECFEKEYVETKFKRYTGKIVIVDDNTFGYGDNILTVNSTSDDLKNIFKLGIIYSAIIGGDENVKKPNIDSMTKEQKTIYSFIRVDSLAISNVEELKALSNSCEVKRFRLLLWRIGIANPMLYFFELKNDKADRKTELLDFIRGSHLTFFKMYSILI